MSNRTCSAPNCERRHGSKGYCNMHYQRMRNHGYLEKPAEYFTCVYCGESRTQDKRGPKPKYCSKECGYAFYRGRTRDEANAKRRAKRTSKPLTKRDCEECGESFMAKRDDAKFCAQRCVNRWLDKHNPIRCSESDCGRGVRAKGLCSMHLKRAGRAEGSIKNDPWNDRRKANWHKRRAQKMELPSENVVPAVVYERDGWICGICGEPVDKDLKHPDPMSASLDHVHPLAKGGHHTYSNTQLGHLVCNIRKNDKVA